MRVYACIQLHSFRLRLFKAKRISFTNTKTLNIKYCCHYTQLYLKTYEYNENTKVLIYVILVNIYLSAIKFMILWNRVNLCIVNIRVISSRTG